MADSILVHYYFRRWPKEGVWQEIHDRLRAEVRERARRNVEPSAAIADTQSVATSHHGLSKGFDGGKLIKGRKRHILVDVMGLLLAVMVRYTVPRFKREEVLNFFRSRFVTDFLN
jgi:putative transposase